MSDRWRIVLFMALVGLLLAARPAHSSERRVALLLANGDYRHIASLDNPARDFHLMKQTLVGLGFEVLGGVDLPLDKMKLLVDTFAKRLRNGDVGLVHYAGHGVQMAGRNYLVPIDAAKAAKPATLLPLDNLTRILQRTGVTGLVFLDSCRDNPLAAARSRAFGEPSRKRGLAPVRSSRGLFIAYATAPGAEAEDGEGRNSPFTRALARHMLAPGLDIDEVMRRVTNEVERETGGRQEPWRHSSLREKFFFLADDAPARTGALPVTPSPARAGTPPRKRFATLGRHPGERFRDGEHCPLMEAVGSGSGKPRFAIAVRPISNEDWQACASAGICPASRDIIAERPVSGLNRFELQPFLQWLNAHCATLGVSYRLPREKEWAQFQKSRKQLNWLRADRRARPYAIGSAKRSLGYWEWADDCQSDGSIGKGEPEAPCPTASLLPPALSLKVRTVDAATRSPRIAFRVVKELN